MEKATSNYGLPTIEAKGYVFEEQRTLVRSHGYDLVPIFNAGESDARVASIAVSDNPTPDNKGEVEGQGKILLISRISAVQAAQGEHPHGPSTPNIVQLIHNSQEEDSQVAKLKSELRAGNARAGWSMDVMSRAKGNALTHRSTCMSRVDRSNPSTRSKLSMRSRLM